MATSDSMNFLEKEDIHEYFSDFIDYVWVSHPEIMEKISSSGAFEDDSKAQIDAALAEYKESFLAEHAEYREED